MANRLLITFCLLNSLVSYSSLANIPNAYHIAANKYSVPTEALYSLAMTESAKRLPHATRPWPWTINVAGKGYHYSSRKEAYEALQKFIQLNSIKRIDVGIAQVNLGWNGHRFTSYWQAFDPYKNLEVAAAILRQCYDNRPGSWLQAAGCYHHPAGGKPARSYQAIFQRHLNKIASSQPPKDVIWIEPGHKT